MSFIDNIIGNAGSLLGNESESLGVTIARTAILGAILNRIHAANNKDNGKDEAKRNIITVDVDPDYSIPVVYGDAFVRGKVTDAYMDNNCDTMWFCITICEKTGYVQSTGYPSAFTIPEVYWNDSKVQFKGDRFTVDKLISADGDVDDKVSGLIEIYLYGGNSITPLNGGGVATGLMPNWGTNEVMSDLVFALVKVEYDKDAGVTRLGNLTFKVKNTMKQPGDVLYDYMTNTRYGAGIDSGEINGL